ncbi:chain length determinant protein EpsF [Paucibacter sp. B51]|uniref:chain length determinant protein EpsF n=1 Tax=Paucibacter sp. B51 TaxID=2993315 RepID=UPI0022EBAAD5|nr:chain length determinant protein EpsF [Paucibacter sp. B51]
MTFSQFVAVLRARWRLISGVFAAAMVIAVALSLLLPKQYTAVASVVVDSKPDPFSAMGYPSLVTPAFMATQVDIIQSERVAMKVVRMLNLTDVPVIREQWKEATEGQGSIEAWLAGNLQKQMDVKPSKESSVISVAYKAGDPKFAAAMANAFVKSYLATVIELKVDPAKQYSSFFDTRAKEARETVEAAQAKLSAFQNEKGIVNSDERLDVETARLNELSSQLVAIQALASESVSRNEQATGASADRMAEVLGNANVSSLKADLSRQEARMKELSTRLGERHPQVAELKASIDELRVKIAEEVRRVTGGVGVTSTINRQRESKLRAELEAQRQKVLHLKQVRDEVAVLQRDVEHAQRAFDLVQQRLNQSSLESQSTQSNINELTMAMPPLQPSSPNLLLNMILGVIGGVLLGVLVAFIRELSDRRTRCVDDLQEVLGIAVIGVLPGAGSRKSGRLAVAAAQHRLVGSGSARLAAK